MNSKIADYFILTRPANLFLGVAAIFLGAWLTGSVQPISKVIFACLSGAFIMAAGNALNDYYDVDIDRVNKPFRPLAANRLNSSAALFFSIILFVLGIFLSIFVHYRALFLALFIVAGLTFYNARLKRTVLFGNIAVSILSGLAFVYGGLAVGRWQAALIPAVFAFLFHLGREIIKDVEDKSADETISAQTLPIRWGDRAALAIATLIYCILIVFTFLPYFWGIFGKGYFWIVVFGVDLVIVFVLILIWMKPVTGTMRTVSAILKADMLMGMLAIYVGNRF
ncbi:MAG: geranylgeranylglycerol-phosphate geranylgeranyltransferase [bacterium]